MKIHLCAGWYAIALIPLFDFFLILVRERFLRKERSDTKIVVLNWKERMPKEPSVAWRLINWHLKLILFFNVWVERYVFWFPLGGGVAMMMHICCSTWSSMGILWHLTQVIWLNYSVFSTMLLINFSNHASFLWYSTGYSEF